MSTPKQPDQLCYPLNLKDGQSKGLTLDGQQAMETPFFAVKQQNCLFVYRNRCPHLGLALEWMPDQFLDTEGHYIQCATHGALFRPDNGLCVSGPCQGESLQPIPYQLKENSIIISTDQLTDISD